MYSLNKIDLGRAVTDGFIWSHCDNALTQEKRLQIYCASSCSLVVLKIIWLISGQGLNRIYLQPSVLRPSVSAVTKVYE